jgi:hypothetical protein
VHLIPQEPKDFRRGENFLNRPHWAVVILRSYIIYEAYSTEREWVDRVMVLDRANQEGPSVAVPFIAIRAIPGFVDRVVTMADIER